VVFGLQSFDWCRNLAIIPGVILLIVAAPEEIKLQSPIGLSLKIKDVWKYNDCFHLIKTKLENLQKI
jgi:hypothetical protein